MSTSQLSTVRDPNETTVSLCAGAVAGVVSTCIVNPLDTLRVRLAASREATGVHKKSLFMHIKGLFSGGFIAGFRAGLWMNLMASTPSNAIYLGSYRLVSLEATERGLNRHLVPIVAAAFAVTINNLVLSPLFIIRTRIQIDSTQSFLTYWKLILQKEGFKGFYRGMIVNTGGRMIEEVFFWTFLENMKRLTEAGQLHSVEDDKVMHKAEEGLFSFLLASCGILGLTSVAKVFATSTAYPYNVLMVHMREVDAKTGKHEHTRILPTIKFIFKQDGVAGFYKGLAPHVLRSVLSKAAQIYSFEMILSLYAVSRFAPRPSAE